jgi:hypothetical protein
MFPLYTVWSGFLAAIMATADTCDNGSVCENVVGSGGRRMLEDALITLASTGGTALVTAMVTDSWEGIKARFARVLGRGHPAQVEAAQARLEQSRVALEALTGQALERARAEQQVYWQTRLRDLLESDPSLEPELRTLISEIQATTIGSAERIEQQAAAFDQAQQAVQGQGVQNVTFGGSNGPGATRG